MRQESISVPKCDQYCTDASNLPQEPSTVTNISDKNNNIISRINAADDSTQILSQSYFQDITGKQLSNLMEYGIRNQPNFIGSSAYLEIQRLLLLTRKRSQVFKFSTHFPSPTEASSLPAQITLTNLRFCIHSEQFEHCTSKNYPSNYVILLYHHETVYATEITERNEFGWIDFKGSFVYKDAMRNFKIIAEVYALHFTTSKSLKSLFGKDNKMAQLELIGKTTIDIKNASKGVFTFRHSNGYTYASDKLKATIETKIQWPEIYRGFFTIGIEKIGLPLLWNKRWCTINNGNICHYMYPCEENYENLGRTISLTNCVECLEVKNIYPKKKSLLLKFKRLPNIYLTPDPQNDIDIWKQRINLIISSINCWNINK
ncbi:hypothetical protein GWI33_020045 [Rhynchophorus ferrugineus]|uniref:PH domain-containing protein n=1 Tax=Rhynchophorus ferrugineus TaxID=354439 RepID=A0A834M3N2_RHYFE|nr:hypothetical protein GWI33_020045 [Rhynchophorus ferrugineus]